MDETHQRMSFIPANNVYVGPKNAKSAVELLEALNGQLYPGTTGNTSLTNESTPASVVFQGGFMNKPITSVREMENGDIIFKYMPKGRLKCPVLRNAEDITFESFKLKWDVSENAMWYDIVVYGVDEDERRTENPVFRADSLNVPACIVTLDLNIKDMFIPFPQWQTIMKILHFRFSVKWNCQLMVLVR